MSFTPKSSFFSVFFCALFISTVSENGELDVQCWTTTMCQHLIAQCVDYMCVCYDSHVPNAEKTRCVIGIDGRCQRLDDVCLDPNASCQGTATTLTGRFCTCNNGFAQDPESRLCLPSLGSECEDVGRTSCIDGSCVEGICQCGAGLIPNPDADRCGIAIGGTCTSANPTCADSHAQCSGSENICECVEGYEPVVGENGVTNCKLVLGAFCLATNECAALNTSCEILSHGDGACTCVIGYVPSGNRRSCLPVATHWPGTCQENIQCSAMFGRYSVCQNNACACANGHVYVPDDFGCVPQYAAAAAAATRSYEGVKLLAATLLPYLPIEAKIAVKKILDEL